MEFAAEMECDCFMFMCAEQPADRLANADEIARAADAADEWAAYGADLGLDLTMHIHTNHTVNSLETWSTYMQRLQTAGLCIDVSHAHLWGINPTDALTLYRNQLNYVHLQEYTSVDIQDGRWYYPDWVDVHVPGHMDFPAIKSNLEASGFDRWVTACPGAPIPGADSPMDEARRSRETLQYLRSIGF